ncbi:MAG: SF1B family DNA helicase RecD2, partial [Solirubrobacteraceae bacterium]
VRFVRFANAETGWAVLDAAGADGAPVALVGPLTHLEAGERARVLGTWVHDARYGPQVKVSEAHPLAPDDPAALQQLLRRVRHIGATRATELVRRFGADQVVDAIDSDPAGAFAAIGLGGRRAQEAEESWAQLRATRRLHMLLAPHGLGYLAPRLHEHYGTEALRVLTDDPYELTSVFGVGFQIADVIARAAGIAPDSPRRRRAALVHALGEAERDGSTCLPLAELLSAAGRLLGDEPPAEEVEALVARGRLVREGEWVYRAATAELEAELARRVDGLLEDGPSDRLTGAGARATADELTAEQQAALEAAFAHRLSVITGGPGTGKTASIRAISTAAAARGARVMLVAPTGRAAVRMSEASGLRARTVHSALGWVPGEGPEYDADQPLSCDLLVVDETSMANLELLVTLLRAVGGRTHVVLVGDADQLAPVGAGKPFAELVGSPRVPVTRLTHIFRQAAGSMIVQGAHAIRRGQAPDFTPSQGMRQDLFLIAKADPAEAMAEIVSLVCERLPRHYDVDPVRDIQVFAPVYRGALGIDALNRELRAVLNADGEPVGSGSLRLGDKLMMTGRNLHELGLMNGTVLRLLDEVREGSGDHAALILGAEDAVFRLDPREAGSLQLAYACSVHRGQGIELPVAVIVAHQAAGAFFLRREMLYTAVTRARLATVIVGDGAVVARAARTPDTARRYGRLGERLARAGGQATNDQLENCSV